MYTLQKKLLVALAAAALGALAIVAPAFAGLIIGNHNETFLRDDH